ncbi:RNA 2'-phosphotransferase [Burkholderia ubonensis]|uniref:RNA 2'-phosphotransferase n=1 Tax=Burkholderia ubonensis TaxID=101571 RepID=UPI003463A96F
MQGHSTPAVQRQYAEQRPPDVLYHGTATRFLDAIREQGLKAGARHHVHLSRDVTTAIAVGTRYGKPVVLAIDAQRMHARGFRFFVAENDVWLTDAGLPSSCRRSTRPPPEPPARPRAASCRMNAAAAPRQTARAATVSASRTSMRSTATTPRTAANSTAYPSGRTVIRECA